MHNKTKEEEIEQGSLQLGVNLEYDVCVRLRVVNLGAATPRASTWQGTHDTKVTSCLVNVC